MMLILARLSISSWLSAVISEKCGLRSKHVPRLLHHEVGHPLFEVQNVLEPHRSDPPLQYEVSVFSLPSSMMRQSLNSRISGFGKFSSAKFLMKAVNSCSLKVGEGLESIFLVILPLISLKFLNC